MIGSQWLAIVPIDHQCIILGEICQREIGCPAVVVATGNDEPGGGPDTDPLEQVANADAFPQVSQP